jgi:glycosyltransferase involved in cell wall biosynthesis
VSAFIDICVPVWNCNPAYFKQAIDSALAQTETRWRMYIHDDASTVDMEAMVKPYLSDARISWHPNSKKLGIGGNWNATMKLGTSPFVQFLFPDDVWEPDFLERGLKAMEAHPNVGIVSLEHRYFSDEPNPSLALYEYPATFRKENLKAGVHNGQETFRWWVKRGLHPNIVGEPDFVMLRRSVVEKAGWYLEDMKQNLDEEYALRCLLISDWYYIPDNCGGFRVHPGSVSETNQREGIGAFDRFRCFEELLKHTSGSDRDLVIQSRNDALTDMAGKFLKKLHKGGKILAQGGTAGGSFKKFALQHPFLIAKALMRAALKAV